MFSEENVIPGSILYYRNYLDLVNCVIIIENVERREDVNDPNSNPKKIHQYDKVNYFKIDFKNTSSDKDDPKVKFTQSYDNAYAIADTTTYYKDKNADFYHSFRVDIFKQLFSYKVIK
jgi:hypothetical protein